MQVQGFSDLQAIDFHWKGGSDRGHGLDLGDGISFHDVRLQGKTTDHVCSASVSRRRCTLVEYLGEDFKPQQAPATDMGRISGTIQTKVLLSSKPARAREPVSNPKEGEHVNR